MSVRILFCLSALSFCLAGEKLPNTWLLQFRLKGENIFLVEKREIYSLAGRSRTLFQTHEKDKTSFSYRLLDPKGGLIEEIFILEPDVVRGEFENPDGTWSSHRLKLDSADVFVVLPYSRGVSRLRFFRHVFGKITDKSMGNTTSILLGEYSLDE